MATITVTRTAHDLTGVATARSVVAQAFVTDPMLLWVFRDLEEPLRLEATAAWLGVFVEAYARRGRVDALIEAEGEADGDGAPDAGDVAAAVWRPATVDGPEFAPLPTLGGLLTAIVGQARMDELVQGFALLGPLHPHDRHAYLQLLAVVPHCQGRGLGRLVLRPCLDACDAAGEQLYLETMSERNVRFYRSLGFEITGEVQLPAGGPHTWGMVRRPC